MVRWSRPVSTRKGRSTSQRALRTTAASGVSESRRSEAPARASTISVRWPRCSSTSRVGRCGTRSAREVSTLVMSDPELLGARAGGGALVARPDLHALLARQRQEFARKREHHPLLHQTELLEPVVPERADPLHTRLHDVLGS